jgi:predicted ATPase
MEGERVRQVAPLGVPGADDALDPDEPGRYPAVALFLDRARAAQPGFRLTAARAEGVKEICRRLDGVPLALELAAARTRSMSPAEIAERLDRPFQLLSGSRRTGHGVQRTLRETVDWSYGLLALPEQRLFNRLAVFAGGFTLDAAEAVGPGPPLDEEDVAEALVNLVDKSMVVAEETGTTTRYRLLETLREYGHERLKEAAESAASARRHAEYFVSLAEDAAPRVRGPDEGRWVHRLEQEFYNLRAAHSWAVAAGDADKALRLVAALYTFAMWRMRYEVATWAERALDMPDAARHPLVPTVLGTAAHGAWARGAFKDAIRLGELGLAAERDLATPPSWLPRNLLAHLAMFERRFEDAFDHAEVNVTLAREHGERYELAYALWLKASVLSALDDLPRALEVAEQALHLARELRNPTAIAASLHEIGRQFRVKDAPRAMALFRESERIARSVDNRLVVGMATRALTTMLHDDPDEALRAYPAAIDYWYRAGDWPNQWITLRKLAMLLLQLGQFEAAAVLQAAATAAHPSRPVTPGHLDRMATLEWRMGPERLALARERGASMAPDEVLAYARSEVEGILAATPRSTGEVVDDRGHGPA